MRGARHDTKAKKSRIKNLKQKISAHKFTAALVVAIVLVVGGFVRREVLTRMDIALLNKAEAKMRAIEGLPKPNHAFLRRYCTFRSVKFGSTGQPNCSVALISTFFNKNISETEAIVQKHINIMQSNFGGSRIRNEAYEDSIGGFTPGGYSDRSIDPLYLQPGLSCYQTYSLDTKETIKDIMARGDLIVRTSCFKQFPRQVYPEL